MGQLVSNFKMDCKTFTLDSDIPLSGNEWTDSGISLTLPNAGMYLVNFNMAIVLTGNAVFDNRWVEGRLFNATANAVVAGTTGYLFVAENIAPNADYFIRTGLITAMLNITRSTVVKLQYAGHSLQGNILIDHTHSSYGYMMVGA